MFKHSRAAVVAVTLLFLLPLIGPGTVGQTAAQSNQAAITARVVDASGKPLAGACYGVGIQGSGIYTNETFCDKDDGANDGVASFNAAGLIQGRPSTLTMIVAPRGYQVGEQKSFTDTVVDLTFTPQKGGSRLQISSVDQNGKPVTGGCFHIYPTSPLGGYAPIDLSYVCTGKSSKGVATLDGTPEGRYVVQPGQEPTNYGAIDQIQNVKVEQGKSADVRFAFAPAGSVTLTVLNPDGSPNTVGGCWLLNGVNGTKTANTLVCGPDQTGAFIGQNILEGSYELSSFFGGLPKGMTLPKKLTAIVVKRAKQTSASVQLEAGGQGIVVSALDPSGQPVSFTCFNVYSSKNGRPYNQVGNACSSTTEQQQQTGTATLWGIEPGDYFVQATQFGQGNFPMSPLKKARVKAGKETDVTLQAGPGATLTVRTRDENKKAVMGACIGATTDIRADCG